MPTFPSYSGPPLPEVLNPLNPRHYLMLADWVYFKPSRLKQYLHRADPDLYRQSGWRALATALRQPAYRNALITGLVLTLLISIAVSAPMAWLASAVQGTGVRWAGWLLGVAVGVAGGVAAGVALGVAIPVGALRGIFYALQVWPALRQTFHLVPPRIAYPITRR